LEVAWAQVEGLGSEVRGLATGGIWVYIPPNQSNKLYGVEMTSERLFNMSIEVLYLPKKFIPPKPIYSYAPVGSPLAVTRVRA